MASAHRHLPRASLILKRHDSPQSVGFCLEKLEGIRLKLRLLQLQKGLTAEQFENDTHVLELLIERNEWRVRLRELAAPQTNPCATACGGIQHTEFQHIDASSDVSPLGNLDQAFEIDAEACFFQHESDDSSFLFMEIPENDWGIQSASSSSSGSLTAENGIFIGDFETVKDRVFSREEPAAMKNAKDIMSLSQVEHGSNQSVLSPYENYSAQQHPNTLQAGHDSSVTYEQGEFLEKELSNHSENLLGYSEDPAVNDHYKDSNLDSVWTDNLQKLNLPCIDPNQQENEKSEPVHSGKLRNLKPKNSQYIYTDPSRNSLPTPPTLFTRKKRKAQKSARGVNAETMAYRKERKKKSPFPTVELRQLTAETKTRGACCRCHRYRERCVLNGADPEGPCMRCLSVKSSPVCIREKFSRLSLCRDQSTPWPDWTKRYDDMEARNISGWASHETKTIHVSHGVQGASYTLHVREFVPIPGDMLFETWYDGKAGIFKRHYMEPYAIVDLEELWYEMRRYIADHVVRFIISIVGWEDEILWSTYMMAYKRCVDKNNGVVRSALPNNIIQITAIASANGKRQRDKEKALVEKALQLWVASRMASLPEDVRGPEQITPLVEDIDSPYFGTRPLPPVIYAQEETVLLGKIQRPLQALVLAELDALMKTKRKESWLTIYLTLFILSHSCTLTTRRDAEFARQMNLKTKFANPRAIRDNQNGITQLIKSFHKENHGAVPFSMALDPSKQQELAVNAKLDEVELQFVLQTAAWASQRGYIMEEVKRHRDTSHDFFFIAQLYDQRWNAPVTDVNE